MDKLQRCWWCLCLCLCLWWIHFSSNISRAVSEFHFHFDKMVLLRIQRSDATLPLAQPATAAATYQHIRIGCTNTSTILPPFACVGKPKSSDARRERESEHDCDSPLVCVCVWAVAAAAAPSTDHWVQTGAQTATPEVAPGGGCVHWLNSVLNSAKFIESSPIRYSLKKARTTPFKTKSCTYDTI